MQRTKCKWEVCGTALDSALRRSTSSHAAMQPSSHPAAACRGPPGSTRRRALRLMRLIAKTTHERNHPQTPSSGEETDGRSVVSPSKLCSPARTAWRHAEERSRPSLHLQASEGERTSLDGSPMHSPGRTAAGLPCVKTNPHFISACPSCSDSVYNEGSHYTHTLSLQGFTWFSLSCAKAL